MLQNRKKDLLKSPETVSGTPLVMVPVDMFKMGLIIGLEHSRFDGFCNRRQRHFMFI